MAAPPRPVHVPDQRPHIHARVRATARTPAPVRSNLSYRPARFHVTVVGAVEWQFPRFVVLLLSESFSPEKFYSPTQEPSMATATIAVQRASRMRPKYVLFAFIGLMMAYVLGHNESFLIHPEAPVWQHYHPFRWWLLPHGIAGACALLLGPLQFSDRLRQRFTKFHRVAGRIYVTSAMILAPLGAYIQYFEERMGAPRSFSVAGVVDAILLMLTTGI